MRGSLPKLAVLALLSLGLGHTPATRAQEPCAYSTAGFPGEVFNAEVFYRRDDRQRLQLDVEVAGIEGTHRASLVLHYGVSATYSGAIDAFADELPGLTADLRLESHEDGELRAEVRLDERFPNLALVLTLQQTLQGEAPRCPERYVARVPSGSVPPRGEAGALVRFRPIAAH